MTIHPIDQVYVDGIAVAKGDVRDQGRRMLVANAVGDVTAASLEGCWLVVAPIAGTPRLFLFDPADVTTAHDGATVLVSSAGRRYRRVAAVDEITLATILAALGAGGLTLDRLAPGADGQVIGVSSGAAAWRDASYIRDALDTLFGGAAWRQSVYSTAPGGVVTALPARGKRMAGYQNRAVITADGSARATGSGAYQLSGLTGSNNCGRFVPLAFESASPPASIIKLVMGFGSIAAIGSDDWLYTAGNNTYGQLGHGDTSPRAKLTRVEYFVTNGITIHDVIPVANGNGGATDGFHIIGSKTGIARGLWYMGRNASAEAGQGGSDVAQKSTPVRVGSLTDVVDVWTAWLSTTSVACYATTGTTKSLWAWAANSYGGLGLGDTTIRYAPVATGETGVVKVVGGGGVMLLKDDGTVKATGYNGVGQHALGDTTQRTTWTAVALSRFDAACTAVLDLELSTGTIQTGAAIIAISGAGRYLRTWGGNTNGACGDGTTTTPRSSPVAPSGAWQGSVDAIAIAGGGDGAYDQTTVIQVGNRLLATGLNDATYCQASVGATGNLNTFTDVRGHVGTIIDWAVFGTASLTGLMVLTDHNCYSGGANNVLQAGIGDAPAVAPLTLQPIICAGVFEGPAGATGSWDTSAPIRGHTVSVSPVAGAVSIDLAQGNTFTVNLTADVTSVSFVNWPAAPLNQRVTVYLVQDATGGRSVAGWPAAVKWSGAPISVTSAAGARDCVVFDSLDGGTMIFGNIVGQNYQ